MFFHIHCFFSPLIQKILSSSLLLYNITLEFHNSFVKVYDISVLLHWIVSSMAAPIVDAEYLKEIEKARRDLRALLSSKNCAPIMLRLAYVCKIIKCCVEIKLWSHIIRIFEFAGGMMQEPMMQQQGLEDLMDQSEMTSSTSMLLTAASKSQLIFAVCFLTSRDLLLMICWKWICVQW